MTFDIASPVDPDAPDPKRILYAIYFDEEHRFMEASGGGVVFKARQEQNRDIMFDIFIEHLEQQHPRITSPGSTQPLFLRPDKYFLQTDPERAAVEQANQVRIADEVRIALMSRGAAIRAAAATHTAGATELTGGDPE